MAVTDRSVASRTVAQHIESVMHQPVSARTIRRRLQQSGLATRRPLLGLTLDAEPQTSLPPMGLATSIFQQDNVCPHVARIAQMCFFNHQIGLLFWPARSLDLSPIENMWSMVARRSTQITPLAVTPDQLWQRVEASWSAVPPRTHPKSLNQCRGVWQR
ncbi:transposable element Tcb1 transposase [Trichonephila clavipes]|nr:transposable element Tcb1 transposase [Trichonephila clavipes]